MAIPKKLQDELAAAEAAQTAQTTDATPAPEVPGDTAPVVDSTTAPEPIVAEPTPTPTPEPTPAVDPKEEARKRTWEGIKRKREQEAELESKAREVEAKNAEIARLQQMLTDNMAKMDALMAQMQPGAQTPQDAPAQPPIVPSFDLTEDEDDILGGKDGHLANAVRKLATEQFAGLTGTFESRIAALEKSIKDALSGVQTKVENVVQTQEERAKTEFMTRLTARVPNAVAINDHPEFREWLGKQFDGTFSKTPLWDVYAKALNVDADTVAAIQERFLDEYAAQTATPAAPAASTASATPQQANPLIPDALADQVALPRSSSAGMPGEKVVQPITMEELRKLQVAAQSKKTPEAYKAFEDAYKQMEAQILAAQTAQPR